ncbi:MAG: Asp-tRNA(Asn)/Glu-tRNA(Gln) amidotransferase subunit GatB [Planctomycetota bacterium]|jgi:aspartyl-tRNA(Asn)/glutamyl-tRNA(Gln) amidotransferase subunit B
MRNSAIKVQPIVGLEIHVQLRTRTKMFCGCPVLYESEPNTAVCPVCLGLPGALPVINQRALELAMLTGAALNCEIATITKWDRKSYYYPDMPKNYQISQYDQPVCGPGYMAIKSGDIARKVRIRRAHLEEDAGKNIHDTPGCTLVDLNRAGTPLLEIVTEPDIRSADEAYLFCTELQRLVVYLGATEGIMKKAQMRFEPNVNLLITDGDEEFRTPISEIKNLNSFKSVRNAIAYDCERQLHDWENDRNYVMGKAENENRGWNDERGVTEFQRSKEAAHDYRYFPDPDLVPMRVSENLRRAVIDGLPELPEERCRRFIDQYGIKKKDADTILSDRPAADLFEESANHGGPADVLAKQFVNVWQRLANEQEVSVASLDLGAERLAELAQLVAQGKISNTAANQIAELMLKRSDPPSELAAELGLIQVTDAGATQAWIEEALAANQTAVDDLKGNPKKAKAVAGYLRGQVMKISGGKADPRLVGELLEKRLGDLLN